MYRALFIILLSAAALLAPDLAHACRCLPPTIQSSYNNADHVFAGRVLQERTFGSWRVYDIRVTRDGKSCLSTGRTVQVATPVSSATCGTTLPLRSNMLIFAQDTDIGGVQRMTTSSCAGNMPVADLTRDEIDWLSRREIPCRGTCLDPSIPLLNCFVDPCTQVPPCPGATCVANYCGDCTAEFYDANGYQQCLP